ncbi:hypothetical protein L3X38_018881 [Prunus dulcis]|uniref:Uncharacterized protein n=1 Tax=Prunus dulcis TaxID=3755 RepID=A0AAD4ZBJ8_PRUDU|nr:hypothetical protein L3X38_018881 [Prunus dulcis]
MSEVLLKLKIRLLNSLQWEKPMVWAPERTTMSCTESFLEAKRLMIWEMVMLVSWSRSMCSGGDVDSLLRSEIMGCSSQSSLRRSSSNSCILFNRAWPKL